MDKIAEIQSNKSCTRALCKKYSDLDTGISQVQCITCRTQRIQSLISERESALRSENEQLKADLLKEIQQGKAMAEALQDARWLIDMARNNEQADIYGESDDKILAKIDAALEGGGK